MINEKSYSFLLQAQRFSCQGSIKERAHKNCYEVDQSVTLQHAAVNYPLVDYAKLPITPLKLYHDPRTPLGRFTVHNFPNAMISAERQQAHHLHLNGTCQLLILYISTSNCCLLLLMYLTSLQFANKGIMVIAYRMYENSV